MVCHFGIVATKKNNLNPSVTKGFYLVKVAEKKQMARTKKNGAARNYPSNLAHAMARNMTSLINLN